MEQLFTNFKNFFTPLNGPQRALFGLLTVGLAMIIGLLFYWALTPSYGMLFASLSPETAREIVEELETDNIRYELSDNGRTINVPRNQVYDLRLRFAASGITSGDHQGYELFDQNTLGMTDFMQRLNQKRALEGEIARTINSLAQVERSRVHIVIPERSPFQEVTVSPTASVIVNLNRGHSLDKQQIDGISSLLAGSVEGLSIEDVVILDQSGNRISDNIPPISELAASTTQMRIRQSMENHLMEKGQSMLDRVLGPGNSILRISTEHNFDRIIRESDLVDPDSRVIISEERRTSRNAGQIQEPVQGELELEPFQLNISEDETEVQVRNYEVNKTREHQESGIGEVVRISASLLLNFKPEYVGGETVYNPFTQNELDEIRNIMSTALGISINRGDELTVTQFQFQDPFILQPGGDSWLPPTVLYEDIIKYVFLAIAMIVIAAMVYRLSKNIGVQYDSILVGPNGTAEKFGQDKDKMLLEGENRAVDDDDDIYIQKMSDEARIRLRTTQVRTEEISRFINDNPKEAAGLVRTMINEEV